MKFLKQISQWSAHSGVSGDFSSKDFHTLAIKSTAYRTVYILSIFTGLLFSLFSICGLFVYKIEEYQGDEVQVGLWSLCTVGDDPGDYDCTDGIVGFEFYYNNPELWYDCFRFFLAAATFFLFAALMFSIITVAITDDTTNRRYWVTFLLHLIAAVLIITSQTIIALYFKMNFNFMTELREKGLGWIEMTPYNESYSDGYFVTWGCFGMCLLNMIFSLLMHQHDKGYISLIRRATPNIPLPPAVPLL